jgi:hypothetical protein
VNTAEKQTIQGRLRARHEALIGQLNKCHHDNTMHGDVFWACAVVTQLTIEVEVEVSSEPLFVFEVRYKD